MATQAEAQDMTVSPSQTLTSALKGTNRRSASKHVVINANDNGKTLGKTQGSETAKMEGTNVST